MKYFKKAELAQIYHVSEKSVRNWIEATNQGKLHLELYELDGRRYIANTINNTQIIKGLVERGRKYKNTRAYKIIEPRPDFYRRYNETQVLDIITSLSKRHEFPFQYCHVGKGGAECTKYYHRLWRDEIPNCLTFSSAALVENAHYLRSVLGLNAAINVIEIGGRNGLVIRDFLGLLQEQNALRKYIDIDVSEEMLELASHNLPKWLGTDIQVNTYVRDVRHDYLGDILAQEKFIYEDEGVVKNLLLFLGGTIYNLPSPTHALLNIKESMGENDLFVLTDTNDTEERRRYFDFNAEFDERILPFKEKFLLDTLNIDVSCYEVEQFYNEAERARIIQARLKIDLSLDFKLRGRRWRVDFRKGEVIVLWYAWHSTLPEWVAQLNRAGFEVLRTTTSPDNQFIFTVCQVKKSPHVVMRQNSLLP